MRVLNQVLVAPALLRCSLCLRAVPVATVLALAIWPSGVPRAQAMALTITADATGDDPGFLTDFWGIQFLSGSGYIQTATFNLTSTGGFFDFDGSPFLNPPVPGTEPVIGATSGISASDISYPTGGGHPTSLTFTFAPDSFTAGDSFRFSADVDGTLSGGFGNGAMSGAAFASAGAIFELLMSTGEFYSADFIALSSLRSEATISLEPGCGPSGGVPPKCDTSVVPVPTALPLFASGLGGLGLLSWWRRRRAATQTPRANQNERYAARTGNV